MPLHQVYFFWTAEHSRSIESNNSTGSAVKNSIGKHLSESKLHSGETRRSFRVGLSNFLRLLVCSSEDVCHYLGWKNGGVTVFSCTFGKSFPRAASGIVTPVSLPENLQAAV